MADIVWTITQKQRLKELNADAGLTARLFDNTAERDRAFQDIEKNLVDSEKKRMREVQSERTRPKTCELENKLSQVLISHGFVQVSTPVILSRGLLEKMSINEDHPLNSQVFWLSEKKCLRPMLAPNLYYLLKGLVRLWEKPIRIFEVGPCFRKESSGMHHLNEFTMLNLVELGLPAEEREKRMAELAAIVMEAAGIRDYRLVTTQSEVYGDTVDIESGIELGSGAMGPHKLDAAWGIMDTWVGIGFGIERILLSRDGGNNIQKVGRSLAYIAGTRLNI
ncbi:MAG: pyrrolysine--tRNA(Pyl) ligase large subunit [Desulfocucumaceae bacterium]